MSHLPSAKGNSWHDSSGSPQLPTLSTTGEMSALFLRESLPAISQHPKCNWSPCFLPCALIAYSHHSSQSNSPPSTPIFLLWNISNINKSIKNILINTALRTQIQQSSSWSILFPPYHLLEPSHPNYSEANPRNHDICKYFSLPL